MPTSREARRAECEGRANKKVNRRVVEAAEKPFHCRAVAERVVKAAHSEHYREPDTVYDSACKHVAVIREDNHKTDAASPKSAPTP